MAMLRRTVHPMRHVFGRALLHARIDAIAAVASINHLMRAHRLRLREVVPRLPRMRL